MLAVIVGALIPVVGSNLDQVRHLENRVVISSVANPAVAYTIVPI